MFLCVFEWVCFFSVFSFVIQPGEIFLCLAFGPMSFWCTCLSWTTALSVCSLRAVGIIQAKACPWSLWTMGKAISPLTSTENRVWGRSSRGILHLMLMTLMKSGCSLQRSFPAWVYACQGVYIWLLPSLWKVFVACLSPSYFEGVSWESWKLLARFITSLWAFFSFSPYALYPSRLRLVG